MKKSVTYEEVVLMLVVTSVIVCALLVGFLRDTRTRVDKLESTVHALQAAPVKKAHQPKSLDEAIRDGTEAHFTIGKAEVFVLPRAAYPAQGLDKQP